MSEMFLADKTEVVVSARTYVLIEGTTKAPHGAGVGRMISVFLSNDLTRYIVGTSSEEPTGAFSVSAPGLQTTEFTVVAQGAPYENNEVYSHCNYFGISYGDYTPPDILHINFIMGEGAVTSPYTDIDQPMSILECETVTDNIISTEFGLIGKIESENNCDIIINGYINSLVATISSFVYNYKVYSVTLNPKMTGIDSEVVTTTIISSELINQHSRINSDFGLITFIIAPLSHIDSIVNNIIINNLDVDILNKIADIDSVLMLNNSGDMAVNIKHKKAKMELNVNNPKSELILEYI